MVVPHDEDRESVESHALNDLQSVLPVLHWDARVGHLARDELARQFAMVTCGQVVMQTVDRREQHKQSEQQDESSGLLFPRERKLGIIADRSCLLQEKTLLAVKHHILMRQQISF